MKKPTKLRAAIYLTLFVILIFSGIALKRIWGLPQFMVFFHLPAAVFLVLGGLELKKLRQRDYEQEIAAVRNGGKPVAPVSTHPAGSF
ncbi:MAG TPA: hypothetical protein VK968_17825 [Roseimicrobium sp.]|nr:hypothetical protein [Roseimicrobium sp.]